MSNSLLLAWRYLVDTKARTLVIASGIALTWMLPFGVNWLVERYSAELVARSQSSPLVIGAPGSRYDLVLNSLYFTGRVPRSIAMDELEYARDTQLGLAIPLLVRDTAGGHPVVGTELDYFEFRGLRVKEGRLPLHLGECVLGARTAEDLGLGPGDTLLSDQRNLYDISKAYPLRMHITGVLAHSASADDGAVFCDVKTTWIIEGLGHGHKPAEQQSDAQVLARDEQTTVLNASVVEYTEVTPENAAFFHFHGGPADLPLTALLFIPSSDKARTILKGRYHVREEAQLLVPSTVIDELLGFVFQLKLFFDANTALVSIATLLFLTTILLLSLQVRQRQMQTLIRIGCARATIAKILLTELALTVALGALMALAASALLLLAAPPLPGL